MSGIPGHVRFLIHNHSPPKEVFLPKEALDATQLAINYNAGYLDAMVDSAIPEPYSFQDLVYAGPRLGPHSPIPPLIRAIDIDEGDINVLLGSLTDLPFPTTFKTLLGSAMALWAASAPDAATIDHHGLDTAIDSFMDFLSPPCSLPTAISPAPLPVDIPPTPRFSDPLLPSPLPRDKDAIMASGDSLDIPSSHLRTLMPRPLEKGKM